MGSGAVPASFKLYLLKAAQHGEATHGSERALFLVRVTLGHRAFFLAEPQRHRLGAVHAVRCATKARNWGVDSHGSTIEEQKIAQLRNDDAKYSMCQLMNATFRIELGARLRAERERLDLSQDELAGSGGISKRTQAAWEGGEQVPQAEYLALVALKGIDISYVVTGSRNSAIKDHNALVDAEYSLLKFYRQCSLERKNALLEIGSAFAAASEKRVSLQVSEPTS